MTTVDRDRDRRFPAEPGGLARHLPNGVTSDPDAGPLRRARPFEVEGDPEAAFRRLRTLVGSLRGTEIVSADDRRLHAVCRVRLGFADDLEFRLDPGGRRIHFRSRSRVGLFDFGANRDRVEGLRRRLRAGDAPPEPGPERAAALRRSLRLGLAGAGAAALPAFLPLDAAVVAVAGTGTSLGAAGPPALALAFAAATVLRPLAKPALFGLTLLGAAAFGFVPAAAAVWAGAFAGAAAAFFLARGPRRESAARLLDDTPWFPGLARAAGPADGPAVGTGGRTLLLTRLAPALPFTLLNEAWTRTRIRAGSYLAGTALGLLPGVLVQVGAAAALADALRADTPAAALPAVAVLLLLALGPPALAHPLTTPLLRRAGLR